MLLAAAATLEARIAQTDEIQSTLAHWVEEEIRQSEARSRNRESIRAGSRKWEDILLLPDEFWTRHFRFTQSEVDHLVVALDLPPFIVASNRCRADRKEALAMLLCRLSYPRRLIDIEDHFSWEASRLSRIVAATAEFIVRRWVHLLRFDSARLTPQRLKWFARKVFRKGGALRNCWAFIDGTLRKVSRPVRNQRMLYNGWKRIHALKFHILTTPDGIIVHVFGPVEGRRHDETLYTESGLADLLAQHSFGPDGEVLVVYGDPAYGLSQHLICPYKGADITRDQARFNSRMSRVRETVEWGFRDITRLFGFLDYSRNLKVLLQPVGLFYLAAILLTNAHNCLHPSETSQYFGCRPPTLAEYFSGLAPEGLADEFLAHMTNTPPIEEIDQEEEGYLVDEEDYDNAAEIDLGDVSDSAEE